MHMRFQVRAPLYASFITITATSFFTAAFADDLQPVSVTFGPEYIGYDGQWSPAQIRVGTPEQYLQLLPSTTSSENWVAGQTLCEGSTCASRRGGIFYTENSTTWQSLGPYELGYSALSQSTQNGDYGFDNISISDTISTSNQIVAVVDDAEHWTGQFGLGVKETRFQNNSNYLSFISTLVQNNSIIPSHSYGYTAGASYQGKGILGSLTLGGVDTSRYTASDFWFTLASNYIPSVVVRSIEVTGSSVPTNWATNPLQLMSQGQAATFVIDSSTPFLWFPQQVCDNIAQALSLVWDPSLELYVFDNSSSPQNLVNRDLQFTFDLSDSLGTSEILSLKIPYGAFNLQLSYPFPGLYSNYSDAAVNYFPLRRANSTQQYTIGRSFLQETYLIVDYERNSFSLSQALFPDSSQQPQLAAISRPSNSPWPGPNGASSSTGLSNGAKAGIGIGAVLAAISIVVFVWLYRRRNAGKVLNDEKSQKAGLLSIFSRRSTRKSSLSMSASASASELHADKHHPTEMVSDSSNSRFELSAVAPAEMAAADVPPNFFQERVNTLIPQRNDPRTPIELVQPHSRSSISKTEVRDEVREQAGSPAPAYSPTNANQQNSTSVSPYSRRFSSNPFQSGSDNGISPVTGSNSDRDHLSNSHLSRPGSGSENLLSPVSPFPARSDRQSVSTSSAENSSNTQMSTRSKGATRGSLSPFLDRPAPPMRSPSRDSRFKEELVDNPSFRGSSQPSKKRDSNTQLKLNGQSRFSWE